MVSSSRGVSVCCWKLALHWYNITVDGKFKIERRWWCDMALFILTSWWGRRMCTQGDEVGGLGLPDLGQLCPWWLCSRDSSMHMALCLPRIICLVLRSAASGGRSKAASPGIIAFVKAAQVIKIVEFCFCLFVLALLQRFKLKQC